MAHVYPFKALRYRTRQGDVTSKIAPPYDVLDARAKQALLEKDPQNIVAVDLPHVPAKELGPPEAYLGAAQALRGLIESQAMVRDDAAAIYAYRQSFTSRGDTIVRTGVACCLETVPFGKRDGGGILPHEQTFSGPKADRLALMKATKCQISPIYGLHADASGSAIELISRLSSEASPDATASTADGVEHEVWRIADESAIRAYSEAVGADDIFIADGHHRYNTALNYLAELGDVPSDHPARRTMFVLSSMSDPGLIIQPTHRVLGGMKSYSFEGFAEAARGLLEITPVAGGPASLEEDAEALASELGEESNVFGIMDLATGRCALAYPPADDPLAARFPEKPRAWRTLDVTIVQHVIVEQLCEPKLNEGQPIKWAFPHSIDEVKQIAQGAETGSGGGAGFAQLAIIVRPTPLRAVRDVCLAGELMPQKSTFFYPKLATGLFLHPLE